MEKKTMSVLKPLRPLAECPGFSDAFAAVLSESAGQVCSVCAMRRMGHGWEPVELGYPKHDWSPRPATVEDIRHAEALTGAAYAARRCRKSAGVPADD